MAINTAGQVLGYSDTAAGVTHAFPWEAGTMTDLGTLGGAWSHAYDINDLGQVVGESDIASDIWHHAFLWDKGVMTDIGALARFSAARAINDAGQVVGYSNTYSDGTHAVLWDLYDNTEHFLPLIAR